MTELTITYRKIVDLKPRPNNPRIHSKRQLEQLAKSITRFGFTNPLLIDDADNVIAGHGRAEAASLVAMTEVPTIRLSSMSEAEIRAYVSQTTRLHWRPAGMRIC